MGGLVRPVSQCEVRMGICMYVCMYVCMYIYIYIYQSIKPVQLLGTTVSPGFWLAVLHVMPPSLPAPLSSDQADHQRPTRGRREP